MLKPLFLAISLSLVAVACGGGQDAAKSADDAKAADAAKPEEKKAEGDAAKAPEGDAAKAPETKPADGAAAPK